MSETSGNVTSGNDLPSHELVPELPRRTLDTYARLWQFETWLRRLVYIELRALEGDAWKQKVKRAKQPRESDKRLTHMPTSEENLLSYAQLSELRLIISDDWRLFEPFLPPKQIWDARLEEISQIRHRVAHFRSGHRDDLQRVNQLLRDIDHGFWRFCTSLNDPQPILPQSNDPIEAHFLHLDPFPWSLIRENEWARIGVCDPRARIGVRVEVLSRPWTDWELPIAGKVGFLYNIDIHARQNRVFNYKHLLRDTAHIHEHIAYIFLDSVFGSVRLMVPSVIGADKIIEIVEKFIEVSLSCCNASSVSDQCDDNLADILADAWPEYVIGPANPMTFLGPDMPCSFFGV